ncbi:MAG: hypothetical protein JOZ47_23080 [Kutzneria sp.]|nr:hypothetical protein [Kutzneria sp.]
MAEGISFLAASGDDGSKDCTYFPTGPSVDAVDYPGSDPNVTSVGGATLRLNGTSYGSETGWSGSGGGTSVHFAAPDYQTGVAGKRTVPDISADADGDNSGYAIYSAGEWLDAGGASCATPVWAGFAGLANAKVGHRLGNANPALYRIGKGSNAAKAFHDVTAGSNGTFRAGTGYEQVTGWGSLDGAGLAAALAGRLPLLLNGHLRFPRMLRACPRDGRAWSLAPGTHV